MAEKQTRKHENQQSCRMAGGARLLPRVTFGVGVAVLTGVAVVTIGAGPRPAGAEHVMTTAALGAVINEAATGVSPGLTTCCG